MKCEDVAIKLIAYLDRRANSAERQEVEQHLAACTTCAKRAEEFRKVWSVLDEVPMLEPSFGFDARTRERIAREPRPRWFGGFVPQPRLVFALGLLLAVSAWMARRTPDHLVVTTPNDQQQFEMIQDLGVLENYDVLSKFDAPSDAPSQNTPEMQKLLKNQPQDDGG
jgi:anti-sigma factor RsiW